jgi:teichuronic acid biosynthesis glycosyltransferase TuaG
MPERPGVSVIIPTYNRADLAEAAVRSALVQSWDPIEIVVVDDASVDDTAARISRLAADDHRIRLVRLDRNQGASAARNLGVAQAAHDFVAFLDSDNEFLPGKLSSQMPELIDAPAGTVSFTAYLTEGEAGTQPVTLQRWSSAPEAVIDQLMIGCCVNTSTFIAARQLLRDEGGFRTDLVCCEDHELWLRLAAAGHPFIYQPRPLTRYRLHSGSLSADQICVAETSERVIAEFLAREHLPQAVHADRSRYQSHWALQSAGAYLGAGDRRASLAALWRAARLAPERVRPGWFLMALRATVGATPTRA